MDALKMDVEDQVIRKLEKSELLRDLNVSKDFNDFSEYTSKLGVLSLSNVELNHQFNQLLSNYNQHDKTYDLKAELIELKQLKAYNHWLLDLIQLGKLLDDLAINFDINKYNSIRLMELELLRKYNNHEYISKLKQNTFNKIKDDLISSLVNDLTRLGYPNDEIRPLNLENYPSFTLNLSRLNEFDIETCKIDDTDYRCLVVQAFVEPIRIRFAYHFESNLYTSKLNKPEYYLNYITDNIIKHRRFLSSEIQHLTPHDNTLNSYVDQLIQLTKGKFVRSIPSMLGVPNILTHTIHQCLKFDQFLLSHELSTNAVISNAFLNNGDWFNSWLDSETRLANDTFQSIISSTNAWSFIQQTSCSDNEDDFSLDTKSSINCTVSAQKTLDLIEAITDRYRPLPSLQQRANFLIKVQLPLIEKYGNKLTMSLDAFESYSSTFIAAMSSVPGSFGEKHKSNQEDSLGSSTLTKLIKIILNAQYFSQVISDLGEDIFFLELWDHFTASSPTDNGTFEKTIFSELASMFNTLSQRAQTILIGHTASSVMLSFDDYLKSRLWNLDIQPEKDEYSQELSKSYSILKHHLVVIHEELSYSYRIVTKVLIKEISNTVMQSIRRSIFELRQQFSHPSSQQFLNDVINFTKLNTPHSDITFNSFIPLIDRLILLSLPSKQTDENLKERTLSKAMQYAWEDDSTHYNRWCRQLHLNDLAMVGCAGNFEDRRFTVDHVEAQRILRMRVECWR
ncbi:hypothetical protein E3P92_02798 [Wallemia ichthyophaga]|uniref:RAD50-interacting protein 1 n=2 Tax=Wallemia ichthyophaga TaxID=245174 RepID=A0A4T0L429_WALIC|nr:RAD50-interacting protein 1 [Wallemia ichthyophaga EXF-994]TIA70364.1 hypothetical protein E3P91_03105 [Wallemia ichthyophaga]EOQ99235.1 RAD50-interacting protein 1 [Wallemia ichthyophaga EXF-994]TIB10740.1 hypothetical protein E3P90_02683 [Wallemia ichthyophaga]TIB10950.1 hypothetical protein E3P93_02743 [Wallemia ichthyophaga]TIB11658.1 hypothetical protein E3P92_02798 [Wallemia ichthyophaga]